MYMVLYNVVHVYTVAYMYVPAKLIPSVVPCIHVQYFSIKIHYTVQ